MSSVSLPDAIFRSFSAERRITISWLEKRMVSLVEYVSLKYSLTEAVRKMMRGEVLKRDDLPWQEIEIH
jgi:hypothetical protein